MARNRRSSGSRSYTPKGTKRRGQDTATQESSDSDSDDEEDTNQNKRSRTGRGSNASTHMMPEVCSTRQMTDSAGGDGVSSIQQGSVTNPIDLETLQRMEERIRMMEEKVQTSMVDSGGVSVVSETSVQRDTSWAICRSSTVKQCGLLLMGAEQMLKPVQERGT